ncbi:MAG: LamG domain-containing protein [Sedimentisphaerales bacterium]|nr:LamG domain-containing protein [Sedimentisphaerales bacterium]
MCWKKTNLIFPCLALILIASSITYAFDLNDPALVAYWPLDEGTGKTAADRSGNNFDGDLIDGASWVEGIYGSALRFNGGDAYVDSGQSFLNDLDGFTLAGWISAENVGMYSSLFGQNDVIELGFTTENGGQLGTWMYGNGWAFVGADYPFTYPSWHHVVLAGDASRIVIYIDGQEVASDEAGMTTSGNSAYSFKIGAGVFNATGDPFLGEIDDVWVFSRALTQAEVQSLMQETGGFPYAMHPEPEDGALHEDTWINLSWTPGDFAASHDVYLGDNFNDVNNGTNDTFRGNQTGAFYVAGFPGFAYPDGLVPGTTYYWRVDEVNEAEPNSPWKGNVWSFRIPPKTAYFPDPADGAESVEVDAELSWTAGFGAKLHTIYFGETLEEADNATGGQAQGNTTYTPGILKMAKTYYWRVDEFDIAETHKGDVWSFTTEGAVSNPNPAKGAVDVTQTPTLTWTPGLGSTYEIYFGTDASALELKGSGSSGTESYEPGQLEWNTTYYWRVDEADSTNADSPWTGPLWSFTTANFLIIDDMESYNDLDPADPASNRIFLAWVDGFEDPTNGSLVGYEDPPFTEQIIVHSGNQSMPFTYDNTAGKSEATLTLISNRDWTVNGVDTLIIWFRGSVGNTAEQMYVVLNGSARVNHSNPEAVTKISWTAWNINLQEFANQGVNLSNVNSITLGLDSVTGGSGMMYFDDIRLYPIQETP